MGAITSRRCGEYKIWTLNNGALNSPDMVNLLGEAIQRDIITKIAKNISSQGDILMLIALRLAYEDFGDERMIGSEFPHLTFKSFIENHQTQIKNIISKISVGGRLSEKQLSILYALCLFLQKRKIYIPKLCDYFPILDRD